MDETSFSKKKKSETQIKQKNIIQLEESLGIKLLKEENFNTLERHFDANIQLKQKKLGERLNQIQEKNDLSNEQMAVLLSLSNEEYCDIKTSKAIPDTKTLNNIKQNFKISIDWLLYGE